MINIFTLQWQRLRRKPFMVLSMIALTVAFIFIMGGANQGDRTIRVPIHFSEDVDHTFQTQLEEQLNELKGFAFEEMEIEEMNEQVALGNVSFGLKLASDHYTFVRSTINQNKDLADSHLHSIYQKILRIDEAVDQTGMKETRSSIEASLEQPPIVIKSEVGETEEAFFIYDNRLQILFGMTLFFAIYTIVFSLSEVAEEKQRGSWDRIILSPIRKWQVYLGYLCFSFVVGLAQILLIFFMFEFLFDIHINEKWLEILLICIVYTFAIVALGMLMMGLVKKASQLSAVVPIVSVSMAMLGGAYWPIEIVDNQIVLFISEVIPVKHAMDALKAITVYGQDITDITQSLSILLLMGVLFMGIGINLMERR